MKYKKPRLLVVAFWLCYALGVLALLSSFIVSVALTTCFTGLYAVIFLTAFTTTRGVCAVLTCLYTRRVDTSFTTSFVFLCGVE